MEHLLTIDSLVALVTLTALEIVLGIDNIVIIVILAGKLPKEQRARARYVGLAMAMISRIALLAVIGWIMRLTHPLFETAFFDWHIEVSGRDLILFLGGLFLIVKATREIYNESEGDDPEKERSASRGGAVFGIVVTQIMIIDIVFSLDSVITAVGMAEHIEIMVAAIVVAVLVMMVFSGPISVFVEKHPSIKMLALSFLLLIGVMLVAESLGQHIPKGYIYFAMAFSLAVETLNIKTNKRPAKSAKEP